MTLHSMKRGSRARRKALQQAEPESMPAGLPEEISPAGPPSVDHDGHDHHDAAVSAGSVDEAARQGQDGQGKNGTKPAAPAIVFGTPAVGSPRFGARPTSASASSAPPAPASPAVTPSPPPGIAFGLRAGTNPSAKATTAPSAKRTAVQTGERLPAPPTPPLPAPESDDGESEKKPREPLLDRIQANLKGRAARTAARVVRIGHFIRTRTPEQWAWVAVVVLAFVLRIWGIGDKPLHHDESMHAYFSYIFGTDPASYEYNPLLHGPFQFHIVGLTFDVILFLQWIFHVGGPAGNPWINDATARIMPVLFGTATVILPAGLRRELGRLGALLAALLLAISPSFVYFSRFLREDVYFNFFMFAMVVCAVRFARGRETRWLVGLFAASVCAYATFEGVFLALAIFIAFLAVFVVWELGLSLARSLPRVLRPGERLFFSRAGLLLLLGAIGASLALAAMNTIHAVGAFASAHQAQADAQVAQLEHNSVVVLLWVSIIVAVFVIAVLFFQMLYDPTEDPTVAAAAAHASAADDDEEDYYDSTPRPKLSLGARINALLEAPSAWLARRRDRLDPERQPLLWTFASVQWVQWFVAIVTAWVIFAALYWVIPPGPGGVAPTWGDGFQVGVGRGIWEGLYYWAQQQDIARGGQPWYYYLLLIPLYEQLAVVFGLAGAVYSLFRPTRFRLFLVWWFVGSLALYSWAGEKMPWLTIQILLPLMLLAAIALDKVIENARLVLTSHDPAHWEHLPKALARSFTALFGPLLAVLLLLPMVHSMWVVSHQDAADGPHEMMVYVQTTTDVTTVVNQINAADQQMYGGKHQLRIAVGQQEEWPFYWYLRDYYLEPHPSTYATFDPQDVTTSTGDVPYDVLILLPSDGAQFMQNHPTGWTMGHYKLRSWWDEAYKPAPGQQSGPSANWGSGVGVGPYLSYGSDPPPGAGFDAGRAANRVWRWLWLREPLGDTNGSFDFVLIVRNGVPIQQ